MTCYRTSAPKVCLLQTNSLLATDGSSLHLWNGRFLWISLCHKAGFCWGEKTFFESAMVRPHIPPRLSKTTDRIMCRLAWKLHLPVSISDKIMASVYDGTRSRACWIDCTSVFSSPLNCSVTKVVFAVWWASYKCHCSLKELRMSVPRLFLCFYSFCANYT